MMFLKKIGLDNEGASRLKLIHIKDLEEAWSIMTGRPQAAEEFLKLMILPTSELINSTCFNQENSSNKIFFNEFVREKKGSYTWKSKPLKNLIASFKDAKDKTILLGDALEKYSIAFYLFQRCRDSYVKNNCLGQLPLIIPAKILACKNHGNLGIYDAFKDYLTDLAKTANYDSESTAKILDLVNPVNKAQNYFLVITNFEDIDKNHLKAFMRQMHSWDGPVLFSSGYSTLKFDFGVKARCLVLSFSPSNLTSTLLRTALPIPNSDYMFQFGGVKLQVHRIIGGDGQTKYCHPNGIVSTTESNVFHLPDDIRKIEKANIKERKDAATKRGAVFENRPMVRLDNYSVGMSDDHTESPIPLKLFTSITDYFTMQVTNPSLDYLLESGNTIREMYATDPKEFANSKLANPLAVNLSLITCDGYILICRRGNKVGLNPGGWAPAVSGTGNPNADYHQGAFCPFRAAQREAAQEILGQKYHLKMEEITFFGLARTLGYYFPFLFGELRIQLKLEVLRSMLPSDVYETACIEPILFNIQDVTKKVLELYQELDENNRSTARAHTTIFSLLQSLIYAFPNDNFKIQKLLEIH